MRPTALTTDAAMQSGASSPVEDSGWHIVDKDFAEQQGENGSRVSSPTPADPAEQGANVEAAEAAEQEQHSSGAASPTSELRADDVLSQPFGTAQTITAAPGASPPSPPAIDAPTPPVHNLAHTHAEASQALAHAAFLEQLELAAESEDEAESVRSLSRMSQEGSLDGYSLDCGPEEDMALEEEAQQAADSPNRGVVLGLLDKFVSGVSGVVDDVALQVAEVRELLGNALSAVWMRLISARDGLHGASISLRHALREASQGLPRSPVWTLLSLGSIATLAVALATQVFRNKKLAGQLRAHDRELARLVVKILHLQDALHNVSRSGGAPMLRHSTMLIA